MLHDLSLVESLLIAFCFVARACGGLGYVQSGVLVSEQLYPVFGLTCFTVPHPDTGMPAYFEVPGYA